MLIPHTKPGVWPKNIPPGRMAAHLRRNSPEGCSVALLGLADDTGVRMNHGRPGASGGPTAFRAALARYGANQPEFPRVFDAGDVQVGRSLEETHERVTVAAAALLDAGLFPIAIGGGHDLTYPFVRAVAARFPRPTGVYFDAHLDVRETTGSGMAFRRLVEDCGVPALHLHGFRPLVNSQEHLAWFIAHGGVIHPDGSPVRLPAAKSPSAGLLVSVPDVARVADPGPASARISHGRKAELRTSASWSRDALVPANARTGTRASRLQKTYSLAKSATVAGQPAPTTSRPSRHPGSLFVSFDLDVLDAAQAPGVSALNPAGWSVREAEAWVRACGAHQAVRCFDLMELNPEHDLDGRTARIAAHLFLTFLSGYALRTS